MKKKISTIFSDDCTDSSKVVNRKIEVKQVLWSNTWHLEPAHLRIDVDRDELLREADFMASHDIPKLNKANAEKFFNCDDFSIFFAALCAVFFQLYLPVLRGMTDINDKLVAIKTKLIECLKELSRKYKKTYTGSEIDSFISWFGRDSWHKKKAEAIKHFVKKFESSDEDFPYILFTYMRKFFFYQKSPVISEDLRRISLYCAYYLNKNYIFENINKFFLDRFIKYEKQRFSTPENLKLRMKEKELHWFDFSQTGFKSILNLDDVLFLLKIDCFLVRKRNRRVLVHDPVDDWKESYPLRYHFAEFEESIIGLITRCTGEKLTRLRNETAPQEHVIRHLKTVLRAPLDVFKRFPAVAFLVFWATSCVKYNEFKALFQKREKPEVYHARSASPESYHIKNSERQKPLGIDFIPIPQKGEKDNETSKLQYMLFFALCALSPKASKSFFENELLSDFSEALHDSSWYDPKKQLELLNKLLKASHLPTVTNTVDFLDFDGKGFSNTESAVNLIYNISDFAFVSTELGIVQQVNHLDELRDRVFKYHKPALTKKIGESKRKTFTDEFELIQDIDCGFGIIGMEGSLSYQGNYYTRDMKCKVFLETDTYCGHAGENPYRRLYRYSLSTIYIKQARNMFVHYALFSSTRNLLDIRNFNSLLEILYDIKERLENESVLFTVGELYKDFQFYQNRSSFPIEQTESSLSMVLEELFGIIINAEPDYIQNVSTKSADEFYLLWPIKGNKIWKAQDPIFRPFNELQQKLEKELQQETSNDKSKEYVAAKVKERIPECFSIIKANYKAFIEFVINKWKDDDFKTIIECLDNINSTFSHVFWLSRPSDTWTKKDTHYQSAWNNTLQSWRTFFEWKLARKDLKAAKESLKKLDYFDDGFTKLIDFEELDGFLSYGSLNMLAKEIQEIAKQLPFFILFKGIYSIREGFGQYENGRIGGDDNETLHYKWYCCDIKYYSQEKDIELLKECLEYVEYEVLRNERYYPTTPQHKKDFIEWLAELEFENDLDDPEVLSLADKIRTEAKSKLDDINKPFDSQSVNLFKDDPTYEPDIGLLPVVKDLLLHVICHLTSIKTIRDELNGQPILDRNGIVTLDDDTLYKLNKKLPENEKNAYPPQLHEALKQFLNFIFGISGHYESSNNDRYCEKTLLDLYGERFFLYVLRVTFEMSHMKKASD